MQVVQSMEESISEGYLLRILSRVEVGEETITHTLSLIALWIIRTR